MRNLGDRRHVLHVEGLGPGRLDEHGPRVGAHQRLNSGADRRIVVGGLDAHPLQRRVGEDARGAVDGVGHQKMVARAHRGRQRGDDCREAGGHQRRSRGARKLAPGLAQRLGRRRAVRAVGVALLAAFERGDVGIKHGRAAKGGQIDEAVRLLGVAAERDAAASGV